MQAVVDSATRPPLRTATSSNNNTNNQHVTTKTVTMPRRSISSNGNNNNLTLRSLRKFPSVPEIAVQCTFLLAADMRRKPIVHQVSDVSGQVICVVKRGGRLRRRRLRRAVTPSNHELNWSLYTPKASKGFARFIWRGGRKRSAKRHHEAQLVSEALPPPPPNTTTTTINNHGNTMLRQPSDTRIYRSSSGSGASFSSTASDAPDSRLPTKDTPTPPAAAAQPPPNPRRTSRGESIIATAKATGQALLPERITRRSMTTRRPSGDQPLSRLEVEETASALQSATGNGPAEVLVEMETERERFYQAATATRLFSFYWRTTEYVWRWDRGTRRLDCVCTVPRRTSAIQGGSSAWPVPAMSRANSGSQQHPHRATLSGQSAADYRSSLATMMRSGMNATTTTLNRADWQRTRRSSTLTTAAAFVAAAPVPTTMVVASVCVPRVTRHLSVALEFPFGRCHDADLEQMLLLSCTVLLEQLVRAERHCKQSDPADPERGHTSPPPSEMDETMSNSVAGVNGQEEPPAASSTGGDKRLSWLNYRRYRRSNGNHSPDQSNNNNNNNNTPPLKTSTSKH